MRGGKIRKAQQQNRNGTQLTVRQNKKHCVTTLRTVQRWFAAMAAVTMRVTAKLMPEVESVMASRNTEKMSW